MTIGEIINWGKVELNKLNIEDAFIKSKVLLKYILKEEEQYLIINKNEVIELKMIQKFKDAIEELKDGKPLQYIIKNQEFMKLNFYVDERVLIPQPDTEILVEYAINQIKENSKVLDMCTGSGCIAISLAKYSKSKDIFASDISKGALDVAKLNAQSNDVDIKFINSDLFNNIKEKYDVIVSNPPYIESDTIKLLSKDVQEEPKLALDGGKDGLYFYRKLANNAYKYLNKDGILILEIGYNQKDDVMELLKNTKKYKDIETLKDLSGNDRIVICKLIEVAIQ